METYGDLVPGGLDGGLYIQGAGGIPGLQPTLFPAPDIILTDLELDYDLESWVGSSSEPSDSPVEGEDEGLASNIWLPVLVVMVVLVIVTSLIIVGRRWGRQLKCIPLKSQKKRRSERRRGDSFFNNDLFDKEQRKPRGAPVE